MLAYYTEKKQHMTVKQELSHTLYQHDSASRVISRLQKEVTAAREALATLKPQTAASGVAAPVHAVAAPQAQATKMETEDHKTVTEEDHAFQAIAEKVNLERGCFGYSL